MVDGIAINTSVTVTYHIYFVMVPVGTMVLYAIILLLDTLVLPVYVILCYGTSHRYCVPFEICLLLMNTGILV